MASDHNNDQYKPVNFYKKAGAGRKRGFIPFSEGDEHFFALMVDSEVAMISQAYSTIAGRDNGIESVKKNKDNAKRYRFSENAGLHGFGLFAGNGQEIAISPGFKSAAAAEYVAGRMQGKPAKKTAAKPAKAKAAPKKTAPKKAAAKPAPRKDDHKEDDYRRVSFYENRRGSVTDGFASMDEKGAYYFAYFQDGKLVWRSEDYETAAARDNGIASVKKNMKDEANIKVLEIGNGRHFLSLRAGNNKEIARSAMFGSAAAAATGLAYLTGKRKKAAPIAAAALATGAVAAAKLTPADKDDDYLPCKEYHGHPVNDKVNNVAFFKHSDGQFYFAMYDNDGDVRIRSEGFPTAKQRDSELSGVLRLKDNPRYYKRIEKGDYFMDVLYDEGAREVGRSCLRKTVAKPVVAPIAKVAPAVAAAAPVAVSAPAMVEPAAAGFGWLKWLLLGLLALLALWGLSKCLAKPTVAPVAVPKATLISCWDNSEAKNLTSCPAKVDCWDGSFSKTLGGCPVEPVPEPEVVVTPMPEPVQAVMGAISRSCGPSHVTLFDVPNYTPKSVAYLGSNPQFGDSHGLTPSQFYNKLAERASYGGSDRAFLNYMARSLGYGSFKDMDASMFSNEALNSGETGMLGFSQSHALQYSKLDTPARDLEAFRVRAANGQDVHFMKSCGNFMYVCQ